MKISIKFWPHLVGILVILLVAGYFLVKSGILADTSGSIKLYSFSELTGRGAETNLIELDLPKGETEGFYLLLENSTGRPQNNLTVVKKDILKGFEQFPPGNIDERIAYNWEQKEVSDFDDSAPVMKGVDELLVRTNKIDYFKSPITKTSLTDRLGFLSKPSTSRLDFKMGKSQTAKLYFKVSSSQASGTYTGRIKIQDLNLKKNIAQFNLKINVLDRSLPNPDDYKFACYINDRIIKTSKSADVPTDLASYYISEELFKQRLADTRKMGCNALTVRMSVASDNNKMLNAIQQAGFSKGVLVDYRYINNKVEYNKETLVSRNAEARSQFKEIATQIVNNPSLTIPVSFYGIDEPNRRDDDQANYENNKLRVSNIKTLLSQVVKESGVAKTNVKVDVTTAMVSDTYDDLMAEAETYHTDAPILNYYYKCPTGIPGLNCRTSMESMLSRFRSSGTTPANAAYYFQTSRERPIINRYLGGFGLIASGLKGYYLNVVYGYAVKNSGDATPLFSDANTVKSEGKNLMLLYPARDGLISTVQSESIREGITDIKYYLAYKNIAKTVETSCSGQTLDEVKGLIRDVETNDPNNLSTADLVADPYGLPTKNLEALRSNLKKLFVEFSNKCIMNTRTK